MFWTQISRPGRKQILQSSIIWCVDNKHHEFTVTLVVRMVHDISFLMPGPASSCFRFLLGECGPRQPWQLLGLLQCSPSSFLLWLQVMGSARVTGTQEMRKHSRDTLYDVHTTTSLIEIYYNTWPALQPNSFIELKSKTNCGAEQLNKKRSTEQRIFL